ncbi:hypothetical protein ACG873_23205 [Mesorhizobium sp. AaZ16]|uniref:hypothetical protein n=1 Tax=Mesorhizobium sp. AaZ16 TaxID=3402289 RepID=UPI00374E3ACA
MSVSAHPLNSTPGITDCSLDDLPQWSTANYCPELPVIDEGDDDTEGFSHPLQKGPSCRFPPEAFGVLWLPVLGAPAIQPGNSRKKVATGAFGPSPISGAQLTNIYDGLNLANQLGMVMNCEFTLVFGKLGCLSDGDSRRAFNRLLDRLRSWCRERGATPAHWFCWERSKLQGLHVHMQLHVPPEHQVAFRAWAKETAKTLHSQEPVESDQPFIKLRRDAEPGNQWAWTRYMLKAMDPDLIFVSTGMSANHALGIKVRPTGHIPWKQVGMSRSLGNHARQRHQYVRPEWREDDYFRSAWSRWSFDRYKEAMEGKGMSDLMKLIKNGGGVI